MTDILTMFNWNKWANERYRKVFSEIGMDGLNMDTPYGNLLDRIVHIFASFEMWHKRMNGGSPSTVLKSKDFSSWEEIAAKWEEYDQLLIDYVSTLTAEQIDETISYTSLDGNVYTRKRQHVLLHLTAHPNYHRGQISSMFKLMNLPSLPATDMVVYFLKPQQ